LGGADKSKEESINQPRFAADGTLYFINDKTGFWNLYSYKAGSGKDAELVLQEPYQAEFQGKESVLWKRNMLSMFKFVMNLMRRSLTDHFLFIWRLVN
jgi:hypothetical protein